MDLQQQRKIRPTRRSVSGIHAFRRQTGIPFESTLERDFLIRTEFFRSVAEIIAQPIQIPFRTAGGREATYTPDFLVVYRLGNRGAKERGWTFRIHDETRIRDTTLENIRFLERYKRMRFAEEESQWLLDTVRAMGCAPMRYLVDERVAAERPSVGIAHLWHLLAARHLDCDISRPLNHDTEFWVPTDE